MKTSTLFLPAVLVALLAGCAGSVEPEYAPRELTDINSQVELDRDWSQGIGEGLGVARYPITPALDDGVLYAADQTGLVRAIDAATGERQ